MYPLLSLAHKKSPALGKNCEIYMRVLKYYEINLHLLISISGRHLYHHQ